ncbi:class-E vacuolar protein-sorting protein 24 (Vps24p), putative [Trypanosoma equiperdum]|uniref:Class-E vacuolar protein-sorting protein 24 (Vps24p), putative n=2 Tax=Trypanozoon TaxID=39700 RepID=Q383S9_TRYB2|nr:class-E vacuolar protein-sorting protein 24 (Vps24p), putative [Trypanosoma brucei brucei TREU927]EAN79952.1 class-E vacuolar protein-sorting protein 24 (Vps24p), putative [Trypanosoma brucei brucei TREU927]SCU72748.1 class-E vacuolar protein-sorting protein 24 (Vps24p), putative [Trypanosoma equiperdum]
MFSGWFKRVPPEEKAKEWRRQLNSEMRKLDLQIRKIQREEMKVKQTARQAAKKGDTVVLRMLAKEIIHSRKAVRRLHTARTQMNSVSMQLQQQVSQIKLAGRIEASAVVMTQMNQLMHIREVRESIQSLGREMTKAGLIEEMMNDTIDDVLDGDISDTELEDEVEKVVVEVTQGKMEGTVVGTSRLPEVQQEQEVENEGELESDDELVARLNMLRGTVS